MNCFSKIYDWTVFEYYQPMTVNFNAPEACLVASLSIGRGKVEFG